MRNAIPPDAVSAEVASALTKAAPPITVTGATASGLSLNDWVLIATLVYTVLQASYLAYKIVRDHRTGGSSDDE